MSPSSCVLKHCEALILISYLSSSDAKYKSRTLKTEYRRILKLEKTSEGINVKLIFSNKCKHKEPKKAYNAMYASAG